MKVTMSEQMPVDHLIEIAFEDIADRDLAYDAIEKLLGEMGQTGTLSARSVTLDDEPLRKPVSVMTIKPQRMRLKRLTIIVEGHEDSDLELAMTEIQRRVSEQFTSGFSNNDTGAFHFDIDEYAEEKQLDW